MLTDKTDFEICAILISDKGLLYKLVTHPKFTTFWIDGDSFLKHALEFDRSNLAQCHHIVYINTVVLERCHIFRLELFQSMCGAGAEHKICLFVLGVRHSKKSENPQACFSTLAF